MRRGPDPPPPPYTSAGPPFYQYQPQQIPPRQRNYNMSQHGSQPCYQPTQMPDQMSSMKQSYELPRPQPQQASTHQTTSTQPTRYEIEADAGALRNLTGLDKEVRLWDSTKERRMYEDMADLYAIIKTTEHLETAYVRDAVVQDAYTNACTRLISQYKTIEATLQSWGRFRNVDDFMSQYRMHCPRAVERLVCTGVPATVVHNTISGKADSVVVAQTVQHFITVMDSLKLNVSAVDEIQPLLSELMSSLTQVNGLPPSFDGRVKTEAWLRKLNAMRASDELDNDQSRQLTFELEKAYSSFMTFLNK